MPTRLIAFSETLTLTTISLLRSEMRFAVAAPRLSARPGRHRRLYVELKEEYTATSERAAKASPDQLPEAGQSATFGEGIERSLELAHQLAFVTAKLVQDVAVEEQGC